MLSPLKDVVPEYSDDTGEELGKSAFGEIMLDTTDGVGGRDSDWVACG